MIHLDGKTGLLTGASGGIGLVTARTLADAGARVVVHYHARREPAEALVRALGSTRAFAIAADLGTPDGPTRLFQDALAQAGAIDVLVNNAATMPPAAIDDELDAWHRAWNLTLQVNLVAAADLCREALRHFRAKTPRGGTIVNIVSRAAFRGDSPEYMAYASSKAGLVALTRSIARGFGKDGVLAYAVAPGFVGAGMADGIYRTQGTEAIVRDIPLGEIAPPEDVANVVAFLASGLARHATGTTIDINGASYVR